jgi:hypothetical protein
VLPGPDDPASVWRDIPNLPGNVTLLASREEESVIHVASMRNGRVIATITAGTVSLLTGGAELPSVAESIAPIASQNGQARAVPFRIGFLAAWPTEALGDNDLAHQLSACGCDYLAVPQSNALARQWGWNFAAGQTLNTRDGIAHHPGRLQGLSARETGPHGGTLIEVDQDGEIRGTFLPFAPIRRLRFELPLESNTSRDDLVETMGLQLASETPQAGELAWFVTWVIRGSGALFASLKNREQQTRLLAEMSNALGADDSLPMHHRMEFHESAAVSEEGPATTDLERLYQKALGNALADEPGVILSVAHAVLSEIEQLDDADWRERLKPLLVEMDIETVTIKARGWGSEWFHEAADD